MREINVNEKFKKSDMESDSTAKCKRGYTVPDETDDHTGSKSEHDSTVSSPSVHGEWDLLGSSFEGEGFWKDEDGWDDATGHDDGGSTNLELKDRLNVLSLDSSGVSEED